MRRSSRAKDRILPPMAARLATTGCPAVCRALPCGSIGRRWSLGVAHMKVTAIKTFCCHGAGRKYFIVKVETDAGIAGLGEVGIGNWGGAVDQAVRHLAEIVVGEDPFATEAPLAAHVPRRVLPRRQGLLLRHQRHRHRAVGHQGQGVGHARLQAPGRPGARQGGVLSARPRPRLGGAARQLPRGGGRGMAVPALAPAHAGGRHRRRPGSGPGVRRSGRAHGGGARRRGRAHRPLPGTYTRASTRRAPSNSASAWSRTARSSSKTRCGARTRPATARWPATRACPSPPASSGRRSGPSARSSKRNW